MPGSPFHTATPAHRNVSGNNTPSAVGDSQYDDDSPRRQKLSYIKVRRTQFERERIQMRQRSVQESIRSFLDHNTSIDTFKEDLVQSAKKHLAETSGKKKAKASSNSPSTVAKSQDGENDDDLFQPTKNSASNDGHATSFSNENSNKRRHKTDAESRRNRRVGKKTASNDRKIRAKAIREKLDKSLHGCPSSSEDELVLSDDVQGNDCIYKCYKRRVSEKSVAGHDDDLEVNRTTPSVGGESHEGVGEKSVAGHDYVLEVNGTTSAVGGESHEGVGEKSIAKHDDVLEVNRTTPSVASKSHEGVGEKSIARRDDVLEVNRTTPSVGGKSHEGALSGTGGREVIDVHQRGETKSADQILETKAAHTNLTSLPSEEKEATCTGCASKDRPQGAPSGDDNTVQKGYLRYDAREKINDELVAYGDSSTVPYISGAKGTMQQLTGSSSLKRNDWECLQQQQQATLPRVCYDSMSQHDQRTTIRESESGNSFHRDEASDEALAAHISSLKCCDFLGDSHSNTDELEQERAATDQEMPKRDPLADDGGSIDVESNDDANDDGLVEDTVSLSFVNESETALVLSSMAPPSCSNDDHLRENVERQFQRQPMEMDGNKISFPDDSSPVRFYDTSGGVHQENTQGGTPPSDVNCDLSHLAAANHPKELFQSSSRGPETWSSLQTTPDQSRSRCQRMLQLKIELLSSLDEGQDRALAIFQKLQDECDLENQDLEFIFEHIRTAQKYGKEIRWDLIESMIFSDPIGVSAPKYGATTGSVLEGSGSESFSSAEFRRPSWSVLQASNTESIFLTDSHFEEEPSLSRRELYQEVILDLYEVEEECLEGLAAEESYARQQMLIQLLRATSDEEAHLSSLTLDDVAEIVNHIQICQDFGTPVEWPLIQQIVFPLGLVKTSQEANSSYHHDDLSWTRIASSVTRTDLNTQSEDSENDDHNKKYRQYVALSETELDVVLRHINFCEESGETIRWDLVAEILFPCDVARQDMLSNTVSTTHSPIADDVTPNITSVISKAGRLETVAKERARAALSLSNHDWEMTVAQDYSESGYDSFGQDSESMSNIFELPITQLANNTSIIN